MTEDKEIKLIEKEVKKIKTVSELASYDIKKIKKEFFEIGYKAIVLNNVFCMSLFIVMFLVKPISENILLLAGFFISISSQLISLFFMTKKIKEL